MTKRWQGPRRPESERQELIAELRRLQREGVNVDRQDVILATLRGQFEFGWPEATTVRRRSSREFCSQCSSGHRGSDGLCERHGKPIADVSDGVAS